MSVLHDEGYMAGGVLCRSEENRGIHLFDLPLAILSSILARISDPLAATYITCSCRLLRAISTSVPYNFRVSWTKLDDGASEDGVRYRYYSLTAVGIWTRRVLSTIRRQMPGTKVLDLSGCRIVDEDVAAVLADLRCLKCLVLDGCQKLTSAVADALAVSVRTGPRTLSLQRCFGLGPAAAGNLLAAAAADGSRLQCILLSHLDRLDLPRDPPLLEAQDFQIFESMNKEGAVLKPVGAFNADSRRRILAIDSCGVLGGVISGSGIRILALHNCGSLGAHELTAVGITCPMLEFLLLGGSIEGVCLNKPTSLCLEAVTSEISALVEAIESMRYLCVLEVTFFPEHVVQGLRDRIGKDVEVWDFCDRRSLFSAISFLKRSSLKCGDCLWKHITDGREKDDYADRLGVSSGTGSEDYEQGTEIKGSLNGMDRKEEWAETIFLALRAAVNCSDLRRRTPLHSAANCGDTLMVRSLLSMGASAGLKDSAGATALFSAAWFGYSDICHLLLMSGADVLSRNRSGENPLYIAALRGHSAAVEVMLSYCKANKIDWQSADVYGDGWTPLMAAAVADRQDVAKVLLLAAGSGVCLDCTRDECKVSGGQETDTASFCNIDELVLKSKRCLEDFNTKDRSKKSPCSVEFSRNLSMKSSPRILDAQNRYGQTALHIAARRASVWFVVNLLHAGASLDIRDEYKKRPVDIAHNQSHNLVATILKQWELPRKKEIPSDALLPSSGVSRNLVEKEQVFQGKLSAFSCSKIAKKNDKLRSVQLTSNGWTSQEGLKVGSSKRVWRAKITGVSQDKA